MTNNKFEIKELDFVVVAKNHNPTILNPDFLKYNSIVPKEFILAGTPVCVEPFARVEYQNKISITAEPERVIFHQLFQEREENVENKILSQITKKYVETLPHVIYASIGLNPKGHILFEKKEDAESYILNKFIKSGPWVDFNKKSPVVGVDFSYLIEPKVKFKVSIKNAFYNAPDSKKKPAVIILFNFHHDISSDNEEERLKSIYNIIDSWDTKMQQCLDYVNSTL